MNEKDLIIDAAQLVEMEGSAYIPTVLLYRPGKVFVGRQALSELSETEDLNEDFKVDLGMVDPSSKAPRRKFYTAAGTSRSAAELTDDFLYEVLKITRGWLDKRALSQCEHILIAEPLSMQADLVESDWLSNYRQTLLRLLRGKRILSEKGFTSIDFLPEPFAVFQYYRYERRHPLVAQNVKINALVIDFGGGTCDVCIIETTKEGDISGSGRNSKPLAASSIPVGGYYINRHIAEELVFKQLGKKDSHVKKGLEIYSRWRKGQQDITTLDKRYKAFIYNFHQLVHKTENLKISLCKSVDNWGLDAAQSSRAPILLSQDIFELNPVFVEASYSVAELRSLFVETVWNQNLKSLIVSALNRGKAELQGAPITVVLLSGGSSNIGWLGELIRRDFEHELGHAEILHLKDYQEVVAKGLAIECARRFFRRDGDFSGITYNRLCLLLNADKQGCEVRPFVPETAGLPDVRSVAGVLLPSASILKSLIDKPLRWKVKLSTFPGQSLDYYFLRSSLDPTDLKNVQNVEEKTLYTPSISHRGSFLEVELSVKEDGTTTPTFWYNRGRNEGEGDHKRGRPFYLDMTFTESGPVGNAYIGLDFGTSNTSVSYIDGSSVEVFRKRSRDEFWLQLDDLVDHLPSPLAMALARYKAQIDEQNLVRDGFEFIETALALAAYVAYIDYTANRLRASSRLFGGLTQRSAGPLWAYLRDCLNKLGTNATVASAYRDLLSDEMYRCIDTAVTNWSKYKHGKEMIRSAEVLRPVEVLANISHKVFSDWKFGFFEHVQLQRFGKLYKGRFRVAHGRPPFSRHLQYEGTEPFYESESALVDPENGMVIPLRPFIIWYPCERHPEDDTGHCFFFDKGESVRGSDETVFSFKAAGNACTLSVSPEHPELVELASEIATIRKSDQKRPLLKALTFTEYDDFLFEG